MANDEWQTPQALFDKLNDEFNFDVDVAASEKNSKCNRFIDQYLDALDREYGWNIYSVTQGSLNHKTTGRCWMNPPYSRGNIDKFVKKAFEESQKGCTVVGLVKFDPSVSWFKKWIYGKAHEVRMCYKRVRFINPDTGKQAGNPTFPSAIIVWKPGIPEKTEFSMFYWS